MFRPFLIWPSSGWIQLLEKPYNIMQYNVIQYNHHHDYIYYIILYSFSDNFIQPDDDQIRNGRNM